MRAAHHPSTPTAEPGPLDTDCAGRNSGANGWLFFVELPLQAGEIDSDVIGRYCLVELESGARLLRWVRRGYKRGTWNLDGNFGTPSIASATLAAATPVLGIRPA